MQAMAINEHIQENTVPQIRRGGYYVVRRYAESRNPEQLVRALIEAHMC